jgi:hypothetical protein
MLRRHAACSWDSRCLLDGAWGLSCACPLPVWGLRVVSFHVIRRVGSHQGLLSPCLAPFCTHAWLLQCPDRRVNLHGVPSQLPSGAVFGQGRHRHMRCALRHCHLAAGSASAANVLRLLRSLFADVQELGVALFVLGLGSSGFVSTAAGCFCKTAMGCAGGSLPCNSTCRAWSKHLNHSCMGLNVLCVRACSHMAAVCMTCSPARTPPQRQHVGMSG